MDGDVSGDCVREEGEKDEVTYLEVGEASGLMVGLGLAVTFTSGGRPVEDEGGIVATLGMPAVDAMATECGSGDQ